MAAPSPVPAWGVPLAREFFAGDARDVAAALVGKLVVRADGRAARLVEVEAYMGEADPGSHAFRGPTPRTAIMFGAPGRLYVYFSYGMHWCANVVCGAQGVASAVLLRAAQPVGGIAAMAQARSHGQRQPTERDLCRGPGRLTEAFGITGAMNGLDLVGAQSEFWLADDGVGPGSPVVTGPRVGLSRGAELRWRFAVLGSPWVSSPAPGAVGPTPGGAVGPTPGGAGTGRPGAGAPP